MADVFISYARADRGRVKLVAQGLAAEGFSVWWDPEIKPGKKWDDAIRRELESAAAVVTCWSRTSAKSKWVLAETSFADGRKKLAPALIQPCDPPIPYNMVQNADLSRWRGRGDDPEWVVLLAQVRTLVDAKRKMVAVAPPPAGEAEAAEYVPASRTADTGYSDHYLRPRGRGKAGGSAVGRVLLAGVVTVALTFGVLAGPGVVETVRERILPAAAPTPTPEPTTDVALSTPTPVEPITTAPVETHAVETPTPEAPPTFTPPPAPKPVVTAKPTPKPVATPKPSAPAPVATPVADPRQPWIDLDQCTQQLHARCDKGASSRGFVDNATITTQEASFLRTLGVETRTIDAGVAARCKALLPTATVTKDAAGQITPLGTACGLKPEGQGLTGGQKAAIGLGVAILGGVLANQGGGRDQPSSPPPPSRTPSPTTR